VNNLRILTYLRIISKWQFFSHSRYESNLVDIQCITILQIMDVVDN